MKSLAFLLLAPSLAFASVGSVATLEGSANRTPKDGKPAALAVGAEIDVGDVLEVGKGNLKLKLNDESVIMLGDSSRLTIDEASFAGQERRGFAATLGLGKLWTKVSKAVGGAKFEVKTDKAVAGVRGTIFRIDSKTLLAAAGARKQAVTVVAVTEGLVGVTAKIKAAVPKAAPVKKGERKQVAGPSEISAEQWEEKFVQLQANMKVTIGEDLWQEARVEPADTADAFAAFVKKNQ